MKYDPSIALSKATELFWLKGFQACTMRDLQTYMDMRPGSIYSAFGDKKSLFKQVLEHYVREYLQKLSIIRDDANSVVGALKQFFLEYLTQIQTCADMQHCLLVKAVTELDIKEPDLAQIAHKGLKQVRAELQKTISKAQQQNEISAELDCEMVASQLQSQLIGLAVYAKSEDSAGRLSQNIEHLFATLAPR